MKAGLVTFYNTNQSGPLLRAAALERAAEALGVSCEIIAYQPDGQSVQSPRRKNTSGGSRTGLRALLFQSGGAAKRRAAL